MLSQRLLLNGNSGMGLFGSRTTSLSPRINAQSASINPTATALFPLIITLMHSASRGDSPLKARRPIFLFSSITSILL